MAINRRKNNRNLEPREDCAAICSGYQTQAQNCQSGYYQCGSLQYSCNFCCAVTPLWDDGTWTSDDLNYQMWLTSGFGSGGGGMGTGQPMCQYNCSCMQDYHNCMIDCATSPRTVQNMTGTDRGSNFRRGGSFRKRTRRFNRGGGVCPGGYTMGPNGVCQ